MTSAVKPARTMNANAVPMRFLSCCRLIGVPGASKIRRGGSWQARVLLPHPDPVHQQIDVVVDRGRQQLLGPPGRHDRPQVLLAGIPQVDATVVVVVAEEAKSVLVVEGRSLATLTQRPVTLGAVVLVQLRRLVGDREWI